jgi:hypothetical protein
MANNTPTKTTLKKGDNLPPRGKGKKSLMLDAIRAVCIDEQEFLKRVVTIGLGDAVNEIAPNPTLLTLVLSRIEPPLKSVTPTFEFDFDPEADLHKQAKQVLDAMAKGKIPSDVGQLFITSISSMLNIQEKTDFEERLKAIEDASEQD